MFSPQGNTKHQERTTAHSNHAQRPKEETRWTWMRQEEGHNSTYPTTNIKDEGKTTYAWDVPSQAMCYGTAGALGTTEKVEYRADSKHQPSQHGRGEATSGRSEWIRTRTDR